MTTGSHQNRVRFGERKPVRWVKGKYAGYRDWRQTQIDNYNNAPQPSRKRKLAAFLGAIVALLLVLMLVGLGKVAVQYHNDQVYANAQEKVAQDMSALESKAAEAEKKAAEAEKAKADAEKKAAEAEKAKADAEKAKTGANGPATVTPPAAPGTNNGTPGNADGNTQGAAPHSDVTTAEDMTAASNQLRAGGLNPNDGTFAIDWAKNDALQVGAMEFCKASAHSPTALVERLATCPLALSTYMDGAGITQAQALDANAWVPWQSNKRLHYANGMSFDNNGNVQWGTDFVDPEGAVLWINKHATKPFFLRDRCFNATNPPVPTVRPATFAPAPVQPPVGQTTPAIVTVVEKPVIKVIEKPVIKEEQPKPQPTPTGDTNPSPSPTPTPVDECVKPEKPGEGYTWNEETCSWCPPVVEPTPTPTPTEPSPTPTPTPVDVCPEMDGNQPEGTDCNPPVDVCPEMDGNQPEGTDCNPVVPPVDVCPEMDGNQPEGTQCAPPAEEVKDPEDDVIKDDGLTPAPAPTTTTPAEEDNPAGAPSTDGNKPVDEVIDLPADGANGGVVPDHGAPPALPEDVGGTLPGGAPQDTDVDPDAANAAEAAAAARAEADAQAAAAAQAEAQAAAQAQAEANAQAAAQAEADRIAAEQAAAAQAQAEAAAAQQAQAQAAAAAQAQADAQAAAAAQAEANRIAAEKAAAEKAQADAAAAQKAQAEVPTQVASVEEEAVPAAIPATATA